jgi:hypothetical protein
MVTNPLNKLLLRDHVSEVTQSPPRQQVDSSYITMFEWTKQWRA